MSDTPQDRAAGERARRRMLRVVEIAEPTGPNPHIPPDYPLVPIGVGPGTIVYFLDSHGQFQTQNARDLSRNNLHKFFSARPRWLIEHHPRPKKGQNADEAETFKPEGASDQLTNACAHFGYWEPKGRLCGRGAWRGADGDLVLHVGDRLWIGGRLVAVGKRGELVYPRAPAIMRPAKEAQRWIDGPGERLLALFDRWRWLRPELDPLLLTGWIGAAMVGGALPVRPAAWVTGLHGTGKSYLLQAIAALFDNGRAVVFSTDTTAAGVWQALGFDSLPVILDEAERQVDNRKIEQLVMVMRAAYTGGEVQRGGSDGVAHQYPVRSAFLFSSINVIPLRAQDRSRCVILELQPFDPAEQKIAIPFGELPALGRAVLRRMVDHWERLIGDVIPAYRAALVAEGWTERGADTIGTLLACASVLREDQHAVENDFAEIGPELSAMLDLQRVEEAPDWVRCIDHMLDSLVAPWRGGELRPLGEIIRVAAGYGLPPVAEAPQLTIARPDQRSDAEALRAAAQDDARECAKTLTAYGLKVVLLEGDGSYGAARRMVAVSNVSTSLQALFAGTHWQGLSGTLGGWRQPLSRAPGAISSGNVVRFRGGLHRATLVPLELFLRLADAADAL